MRNEYLWLKGKLTKSEKMLAGSGNYADNSVERMEYSSSEIILGFAVLTIKSLVLAGNGIIATMIIYIAAG